MYDTPGKRHSPIPESVDPFAHRTMSCRQRPEEMHWSCITHVERHMQGRCKQPRVREPLSRFSTAVGLRVVYYSRTVALEMAPQSL